MTYERLARLSPVAVVYALMLTVVLVATGCARTESTPAQSAPPTSIKYTSIDESEFWIEADRPTEALSLISFTPPVLPDGVLAGKPQVYVHDGPASSRGLKYKYNDFEILIEPVEGSIDYAGIAANAPDIMRATVVGGFPGLEQNRGVQSTTSGKDNAYPSALQWQDGSVQYTLRSENSDLPVLRAVAVKLLRARR